MRNYVSFLLQIASVDDASVSIVMNSTKIISTQGTSTKPLSSIVWSTNRQSRRTVLPVLPLISRLSKIIQPLDRSVATDFANGSKDRVQVQNGPFDKTFQLFKT